MRQQAPPKSAAAEQTVLDEVRVILIPQAEDRRRS